MDMSPISHSTAEWSCTSHSPSLDLRFHMENEVDGIQGWGEYNFDDSFLL